METMTRIGNSGRITVPTQFRKALGLETGDEVVLRIEDGTLRVIPLELAVRLSQDLVRSHIPEGISLVDALIETRRDEVSGE